MLRSLLAGLVIAAAASAAVAAPRPMRQPDGPAPPVNYDQMARGRLAEILKDPYSAHITLTRPARWTSLQGVVDRATGWAACYSVNAKNSYGAYEGAQTYVFFFEDGRLTDMVRAFGDDLAAERIASECAIAGPAIPAAVSAPAGPKIAL